MSRSGYTDDSDDNWSLICWRGAVTSAIKGKRGQALLREIIERMDAMPVKKLISSELEEEGSFCTLGVVGHARGIDLKKIDPEDPDAVAAAFNIAPAMAREIVYENDEYITDFEWKWLDIIGPLRPFENRSQYFRVEEDGAGERRWQHMRKWAADNLITAKDQS